MKNKQPQIYGLYRSTDPKYIKDSNKSINVTLRMSIWLIFSIILEVAMWIAGMYYSIRNPSWSADGYITTATSIGSIIVPIALGILELLW